MQPFLLPSAGQTSVSEELQQAHCWAEERGISSPHSEKEKKENGTM